MLGIVLICIYVRRSWSPWSYFICPYSAGLSVLRRSRDLSSRYAYSIVGLIRSPHLGIWFRVELARHFGLSRRYRFTLYWAVACENVPTRFLLLARRAPSS